MHGMDLCGKSRGRKFRRAFLEKSLASCLKRVSEHFLRFFRVSLYDYYSLCLPKIVFFRLKNISSAQKL